MPRTRRRFARLSLDRVEDRLAPATLDTFFAQGHTDLNFVYVAGTPALWDVQPRDDDTGVGVVADRGLLYVGADGKQARPAGEAFDFIGTAAGADYWRLPQTQDTKLLYLGAAGYGLPSGAFDRYNPADESKGRASGLGRWAKMTLTGVVHRTPTGAAGTGQFSVWQSDDAGPRVLMATVNDGVSNPNGQGLDVTDGITADDALWVQAGGHTHFNYGFTQPGRYEVTVRLSAYLDDGNTTSLGAFVQSEPITLYFSVGSVGQLAVDPASYTVQEDDGTATVTVRRTGGSDGRITVNYATANGTATAGQDYTATTGTLTFNDGETVKTVSVPILNDSLQEGDETFTLVLSQPGPTSIAGYVSGVEGKSLLGAATATVTIPANDAPGANQPPTIGSIADATVAEDLSTGTSFTVSDDQTPADSLTVTAVANGPTPATAVVSGTGANRTVIVTPAADAFGPLTVTVTVTDGGGLTASRTFAVTVTPVADAPVVATVTTLEDALSSAVTITPNPADGAEVTHFLVAGVVGGTLYRADGQTPVQAGDYLTRADGAAGVRFLPAVDRNGLTDPAFGFDVRAALGTTTAAASGATLGRLTVTPVNDRPTGGILGNVSVGAGAVPFSQAGFLTGVTPGGGPDEATQVVTTNITAANPGLFSVPPAISADGTLTFTPAAGQSGTSEVTITLRDDGGTANGGQDTATFTFVVGVAANVPPEAVFDGVSTPQGVPVLIPVLANDTDADGDPLTLAAVGTAISGTTEVVGSEVRYTPNAGFTGLDSFTYTVSDGRGGTAVGTVNVTVTPGNRPPVANPDAFQVAAGDTLRGNVLLNDTDPEAGPLTAVVLVGPANGTLALRSDGSFTYAPGAAFAGTDSFTYTVSDGGLSATGTVTISGRLPAVFAVELGEGDVDLAVGFEGGAFEPHVHDEENDAEYEPGEASLLVSRVGAAPRPAGAAFDFLGVPAGATIYRLPQAPTGGLLYLGFGTEELEAGVFAADTVTFRLLSVEGPGDLAIWNATDTGPVVLAATAGGIAAADAFLLDVPAHTHYNLAFTAPGRYAVTVRFEGRLASDNSVVPGGEATYFFRVEPANRLPVAGADAFGLTPGNALRGDVLANDTDADGDRLTVAVRTGPTNGSLTLRADGSFTYTPAAGFAGTDTFTYAVADGFGEAVGTVTVTGRPARPEFDAVLSDGDVDVGVAFEGGAFDLHVHQEEPEAEFAAGDALLHVREAGRIDRPAGAAFDFLGVPAGTPIYRLTQSPTGSLLYLGFGTEELAAGVFRDDRVTLRVVAVDGPGELSVWESTDTGPRVLVATANGLTGADLVPLTAGQHVHFNWGFTARGLYAVTMVAGGVLADGTAVTSEPTTYYLAVDPANAAPTVTAPAGVSVGFGQPVVLTGLTVADADAAGQRLTLTVSSPDGRFAALLLPGETGDTGLLATRTRTGTLAELNAVLADLAVSLPSGFSGTTQVTVSVTDGGVLVGPENARTAVATVPVTVAAPPPAANQPPTIAAPAGVSVGFGQPVVIAGLTVADPDNGSRPLTVTVSSPDGRFAALVRPGEAGDTSFQGSRSFTGSLAEVNAVLADLRVVLPADFRGSTLVTVRVTDGGTAADPADARTTTATIPITVAEPVSPPTTVSAAATATGFALTRTGGDLGQPFTVAYTVGGSAVPGVDYAPLTGSAAFAAGQTTLSVNVTPLSGRPAGTRAVVLTPTGGAPVTFTLAGEPITPPAPRPKQVTAVAAGNQVWLINPDRTVAFRTFPFGEGYAGTVRVASADVTGDGVADVVVGAGPGDRPRVAVIDGASRKVAADFLAFEASFTGGVFVAAADLTGDGVAELIVTPDEGGGPVVAVFTGGGVGLARFFGIEDPNFRGGARAGAADLTGDGIADLVVSAGFGGGPRVAVYDGATVRTQAVPRKLLPDFFAYESTLRNGTYAAAGDVNGDGVADLVLGAGPGGGPRVRALDGKSLLAGSQVEVANFFAGPIADRGGVRVAARDVTGDDRAEIVVGSATTGRTAVYAGDTLVSEQDGFGDGLGGVFVG